MPHSEIHRSQPGYRLPVAYRRFLRLSSPLDTKTSTVCPLCSITPTGRRDRPARHLRALPPVHKSFWSIAGSPGRGSPHMTLPDAFRLVVATIRCSTSHLDPVSKTPTRTPFRIMLTSLRFALRAALTQLTPAFSYSSMAPGRSPSPQSYPSSAGRPSRRLDRSGACLMVRQRRPPRQALFPSLQASQFPENRLPVSHSRWFYRFVAAFASHAGAHCRRRFHRPWPRGQNLKFRPNAVPRGKNFVRIRLSKISNGRSAV